MVEKGNIEVRIFAPLSKGGNRTLAREGSTGVVGMRGLIGARCSAKQLTIESGEVST